METKDLTDNEVFELHNNILKEFNENPRIFIKYIPDGEQKVKFADIRKGDKFYAINSDGTRVQHENGAINFMADSNAFIHDDLPYIEVSTC